MRRISQQEWENEHMHDPMTEGEALAVLPDYDAGLLNDYGGGNVEWWQDYLRAEIGRANDYWRENIAAITAAQQPEARGVVIERDSRGLISAVYENGKLSAANPEYVVDTRTAAQQPVQEGGGVDGGAWTESDMERPWGAESAFLRHLASDPALNLEQSAMLRHCAKRIESTAGIHLRALADMLDPAKQAGILRVAVDALTQQPAQAAPGDDEFAWREGWALAYSGADHLYGDDGELQDNRWPTIDWRRDSALEIRRKIEERGNRALAAAQAAARATRPGDDAAGGGS